jgi:hypothetical protein
MKGKYRVEFSVPAAKKRRVASSDRPGEFLEEPFETLPSQFNHDSKFILDYYPDDPKPFNADLTSR